MSNFSADAVSTRTDTAVVFKAVVSTVGSALQEEMSILRFRVARAEIRTSEVDLLREEEIVTL